MKYSVVYDSPGRLRLRCGVGAFNKYQENSLVQKISLIKGVCSVQVSSINGGILVYYDGDLRERLLEKVSSINPKEIPEIQLTSIQEVDAEFKKNFALLVGKQAFMKFFVPPFIKLPLTVIRALPFVKEGIKSLAHGKMNVALLDAVSVSASILSGSPSAASSIMTLLGISSLLEDYTRKKAKNALSDSLSLNIDKVWRIDGGTETLVPLSNIKIGDTVRARTGSMIPVDGFVTVGSAGVNESSMTGEAVPVIKEKGMSVYAGTVVDEGSIDILTDKLPDNSRINGIIDLIENSEELKSGVQTKAEKFADSLVPFSLLTSALSYIFTGNVTKALSVLMVDYSCAIKLSTPICVISAMREATNYDIMIKGGRYLENYAFADTIVFDKTGTLTVSCPTLAKVIPFGGFSEDVILCTSACPEEHFPHSVAKSIVHAATERGLEHREEHADVEYIVAHGIASYLNGKRVLIGSAHFIFDDEKVELTDEQKEIIIKNGEKYSMIYLAIAGKLCGILCIEDPIRPNTQEVIARLRDKGMTNVMMITGDGESTASTRGHKVVMVGDGVNDSPALAAADVSIAMKDASDIAREVADITLLTSNLDRLVVLRDLSENLFARIHSNYRFISLFNSALILLGIGGVITPVTSALMHNVSTMGICIRSMRSFID